VSGSWAGPGFLPVCCVQLADGFFLLLHMPPYWQPRACTAATFHAAASTVTGADQNTKKKAIRGAWALPAISTATSQGRS